MVQTYGKKVLVFMVLFVAVAFVLRQTFVPDSVKSLFRY
jgi:hypothetical protein